MDRLYFIVTLDKPVSLLKMEDIERENLILQVQKHACLYNMSLQAYRDQSLKRLAWLKIAKKLNLDGQILFSLCKADRSDKLPAYGLFCQLLLLRLK